MILVLPPRPNWKPMTLMFAVFRRGESAWSIRRRFRPGRLKEISPTPRRRAAETSLSTKVPEYVMQQLRLRYAEAGITIRNQILIALRKEGLEINEDDIQDERKRPRK